MTNPFPLSPASSRQLLLLLSTFAAALFTTVTAPQNSTYEFWLSLLSLLALNALALARSTKCTPKITRWCLTIKSHLSTRSPQLRNLLDAIIDCNTLANPTHTRNPRAPQTQTTMPTIPTTPIAPAFWSGPSLHYQIASLITRARKSVDILMYLISANPSSRHTNPHPFVQAVIHARRAHVPVRIILPTQKHSRHPHPKNHSAIAWLINSGCNVRLINQSTLLHSKLFILDRAILIHSTANLSSGSWRTNIDTALTTDHPTHVTTAIRLFTALWQTSTPVPTPLNYPRATHR